MTIDERHGSESDRLFILPPCGAEDISKSVVVADVVLVYEERTTDR